MATDKEKGDSSKPMLGDRPLKGHKKYELVEETTCGIGFFKHKSLQRFANQKSYTLLYGLMGMVLSAAYSYFNGTITTIEKRYEIPSRVTGIISVGNDISTLIFGALITYFAGKGHRPRWIAFGLYTVVLFCLLNALPHLLYGAGEDALALTKEYGGSQAVSSNISEVIQEKAERKLLCRDLNSTLNDVELPKSGSMAPSVILFISQFVSGIGGSLYFTLGVAYLDDNSKRSDAPTLVSFSQTIRMLGPALGYSLSSLCLKYYIAPTLTPKITNSDPRWLGAWWLGWILLAFIMFLASSLIGMFPRELPKARYRRQISALSNKSKQDEEPEAPASIRDLLQTCKRLLKNKVLMLTNCAGIFFFFGYMPYWIYSPKYIEVIYKKTASEASLYTGSIGLVFSAIGIMIGGIAISKLKPSARVLAGWNMTVSLLTILGMLAYSQLGCPNTHDPKAFVVNGTMTYIGECNTDCSCESVKYTPVCSYGESFISPCHAGCKSSKTFPNGTKIYTDCGCIKHTSPDGTLLPQIATSGPCEADCDKYFFAFLAVICALKFFSATARTSNFLISVRCVDSKDKAASMGFGATVLSLFAFIPSPIFFGNLIDNQCLVWGKTSTGTSNCWLYDADALKYALNFTAAGFMCVGLVLDSAIWYYAKGLPIFDEDEAAPAEVTTEKELDVLTNGKLTEPMKAEPKPINDSD